MQTRSMTRRSSIAAQDARDREWAKSRDIEHIFRLIHQGKMVLVNPSDLTDEHRILWWVTGLEEGKFTDDDIPEKDYPEVYSEIHQR